MLLSIEESGAHSRNVEEHRHADLYHTLENTLFFLMSIVSVELSGVSSIHQRMHKDNEVNADDSDPIGVKHPFLFAC